MTLYQKLVVKTVKRKMGRAFKVGTAPEISSEGIKEYRDIKYTNRVGKELFMDIFEPETDDKTKEFPVIINIHGGGLISGNKKNSVGFCRLLAKRGFIVFSLEYRLVPMVQVYEQFDDVCAGMDTVGKKLIEFSVDLMHIYLTAESAGAYLALYVAAMTKSKKLQEAIGYEPTKIKFKAMALSSGMFYTRRKDALGRFMSPMFYGKDEKSKKIEEFTNPENPEIIYNIPPVYLITSKADMLERYTLDFAGELGNKGIEHKLRHMGSDPKLLHAYPVIRPDYPESERVVDEIVNWFNNHR
mgnify:CR=1 FL=1